MNDALFTVTPLDDLAVLALTGPDATSFLQSQITQDVDAIGTDSSALAGYCTARGRLLASMIVLRKGADLSEGWLLLCKADVTPSLSQRLRMFILRAKVDVEISDVTVTGITARSTQLLELTPTLTLPTDAPAYTVVRDQSHIAIRTPGPDNDELHTRWWVVGAPVSSDEASEGALPTWQAYDIAAGLPWVQAATQETFIPQTLNMDLIDGVSFTKGCYPGQEVVARSHYRGTVRRRMAYATGSAANTTNVDELSGTDTFNALKPKNPCGRVINAAISEDQLHVLIEVQLADLDDADFRLGSGDGPAITVSALPYSIQPDTPA